MKYYFILFDESFGLFQVFLHGRSIFIQSLRPKSLLFLDFLVLNLNEFVEV